MDRMNASDAVLWAIERDPNLRSTVTAVALLDRSPDAERLRRRVEGAVGAYPRLRKRVAGPRAGAGHPRWVPSRDFDLDRHLRRLDGGGAGVRWLLDAASLMAAAGFDRSRPLWELAVVDHLRGGRAALIQKFHHSLTDGVGGIELLLSLLDSSRHPRREPELPPVDDAGERPPWAELARQAGRAVGAFTAIPPYLARSAGRPVETVAESWRTGRSVTRLLAPATRPLSPAFGRRGTVWQFEILDEPMERLHAAASATGGTVNDVFVAAVAGALHSYHVKLGHPVRALRINLPVSFRHTGDPVGGNRFTPVRFVVPVDEPDAATRVRQVGSLCRKWRHEPALPLTEAIADALSRLPDRFTTAAMASMMYGVDFVATNVPGVAGPAYVAGAKMVRQYAFAPPAGAAVNFALVSHAGTACIGLNIDVAAVPSPDLLSACLRDSLDEIVSLGV